MSSVNEITHQALGCAFQVSNELGHGFLERVYENAVAVELRERGIEVKQQVPVPVKYKNQVVGVYVPDLILDDRVVLEIKAIQALDGAHTSQCINYLRATGHRVGLILNFGRPRLEYRRVVWNY